MRATFGQLTRLSALALLLGPLFGGCFKHPTPGTACFTEDNCRKNQECVGAASDHAGTCQERRDAGAGFDGGPRADGAADATADVRPGTADVSGHETAGIIDLALAIVDGGSAADVVASPDLASAEMGGSPSPDGLEPADLGPISVDVSVLADTMTAPDLAPPPADAPVTTPDSGVVAVDTAILPPSPDASADTQPQVDTQLQIDTPLQVDTPIIVAGPFTISVSVGGNGTGSVTSNLAGIGCPGDCSESYAAGTPVELTASPGPGSIFAGWTGAGCGSTSPCAITLNGDTGVIATFNLAPYTLTVGRSGDGTGTVVSEPAGIACGTTCAHDFASGTTVRLTATGSLTSVFTAWSGDCSGSTNTCTVSMSAAHSVSAGFKAVTPLTCTTLTTAQSCAAGSIPDINLGSGLDAQTCHDRCQAELAADGATTGCWIVGDNGDCLCRNGALTSLNGSLHTGGGCTGNVGSITCGSVTNALACTAGAAEYDMGSEYTVEGCRSACELLMNTRSYPKGCWLRDPMHCYCRRGDIILGYSGGSCTAP